MKKHLLLAIILIISGKAKSQIYATSQTNVTCGTCIDCSILNPGYDVDPIGHNFTTMNLTPTLTSGFIKQQLHFSTQGFSGDVISVIVEDPNSIDLNADNLDGITITTYNQGISNADTKNSHEFSIQQLSGSSTKYIIEFQSHNSFDAVEIKFEAGNPGALNSLNIYSVSYENQVPATLDLYSFIATPIEDVVELQWQILKEININFYTIESSTDAINFSFMSTINAIGTSYEILDYFFIDAEPKNGLNYYRLSQTDFNGNKKYFNTIVANVEKLDDEFSVYPNPTTANNINVSLSGFEKEEVSLLVTDVTGKSFYSEKINCETATQEVTLSQIKNLPSGIYNVVARSNTKLASKKIIVQ